MSSTEKIITVSFILEALGRPKEHLVQALEELISKMDKEQKVSVISKKIHEPVVMKNQPELFTTYAEVEVEIEELIYLMGLVFKYMPASIEVISPEKLIVENNNVSELLSELARKLHGYDELARMMQADRAVLLKKIEELTPKDSKKEIKKPSKKK
jgi:hypothetical protein